MHETNQQLAHQSALTTKWWSRRSFARWWGRRRCACCFSESGCRERARAVRQDEVMPVLRGIGARYIYCSKMCRR
jgi:hypothetical protein